jgi:hypothetical protein
VPAGINEPGGLIDPTGLAQPGPHQLVRLEASGLEPADGFSTEAIDSLTSLTIAPDGAAVAGLDGQGGVLRVLRGGGTTRQVVADAGGVPPVFDARGRLWTGVTGPAGVGVASLSRYGANTPVTVPWLEGETLLSLAPAPDAIRLLVVSRDDTGAVRLRLAAIERNGLGVPTALGPAIQVASLASAPVALAWVDQLSIALLAAEDEGQAPTPQLLVPGGLVTPLRPPGGNAGPLVALAASPDPAGLLVVAESGALFSRVGPRWEQRATRVHQAAYPA